ncbi:hypothetical protein [Dactylosporangium sp. NPDC051541]|uniref:hypothetical protein n=1 Tax=Dactylosporangium sp. NPDC051541 TaxID=3363977 RepID=UPI0037A0084E
MSHGLRQALVALLTVGAVVLGPGAPAEAATTWSFSDGFETTASLWYDDGDGPQDCPRYRTCNPAEVVDDADQAYRGSGYASILNNSGYGANWLSLGRQVRLTAGAAQCTMGAWINVDYARSTPVTMNLEVIRVDGWTYETLKTFQLTDLSQVGTWHRYSTGAWTPGTRDVVVRFVLVGQEFGVVGIHVDDVGITCKVI